MTTLRISAHYIPLQIALLAVVEALAVFGCFFVAFYVRFAGDVDAIDYRLQDLILRAGVFSIAVFVGLVTMGLYRARQRARIVEILPRIGVGVAIGTVLNVVIYYALPFLITERSVVLLAATCSVFGLSILRSIVFSTINIPVPKNRVIVLGAGEMARPLARLRRDSDQRSSTVLGFIPIEGDTVAPECASRVVQPSDMYNFINIWGVDEIVVSMEDRRLKNPMSDLLKCRLGGIRVTEAITFLERETAKIDLDIVSPGWMIFSDGFRQSSGRVVLKRLFDLLTSSVLLVLAGPLMLLTALLIWMTSGFKDPILYRQSRVGLNGNVFGALKFRSMHVDAEADGVARWSDSDDDRVTMVGSVIRRFRIDELPQLFNVLRGEMSFVGPRPERPEFVQELGEALPFYHERHCMKPGLTGWAQVSYPYGSSVEDARQKLQYDLYYVKNHSLIFDLMILLQTIDVVVWGRGTAMPDDRRHSELEARLEQRPIDPA